jgi:hypothetical protein
MLKRSVVTGVALAALVATGFAAVQVTAQGSRIVCLPPAVVQAWS